MPKDSTQKNESIGRRVRGMVRLAEQIGVGNRSRKTSTTLSRWQRGAV